MKNILAFLRSLRVHNDREWFQAHKDQYLEVKQSVEQLTQELISGICEWEPQAASLRPADCLYRIYRDTRFSADKTPYKTHIGIYINPPGGKKSPRCGYYLHIEPGNSLVAGGCWCPPAPILKALRKDIFDNVEEYLEIINAPDFTQFYSTVGDNLLKTAPKGFLKDWQYIDLLKPRDYTAYTPLADSQMESEKLLPLVLQRMKAIKPLNDFFNYTIDETGEID